MIIKQRLEWLLERKLIMFFLWKDRFLNPLIPAEQHILKTSGLLNDVDILQLIDETFPEFKNDLPSGMYFPVPISRALKEGIEFSNELALKFHYDFIKVDENQKWSLRNKNISGKVLSLFESNLYFEKETQLYFVEYWSDSRWDKCYLECDVTPLLALAIDIIKDEPKVQLNNHKTDSLDLNSFRIDSAEKCFVQTLNHGEVLLADAPRFWLLDHLDESGTNFVKGDLHYPLSFSMEK